MTQLAHRLSSEITHIPTCAVAEFTFNAKSWSHIGKPKLAKVVLDYPKKSYGNHQDPRADAARRRKA